MDEPRYLAKSGVRANYVPDRARAMHNEPEPVSESALTELAEQAERHRQQARIQAWSESKGRLERELNWLRSQRFRKDVRSQVRAVERTIAALDKRIDGG